jgi:coenzyme F420 hydrogenase subunit beta
MDIIPGELYAGYAGDARIRQHAASGGLVSAILIDLLERKQIDGALVSRITSSDGHIVGETTLVKSAEGVLRHAGSSYIDTPVIQKAKELATIEGRYAVVALPCQVRALRAIMARDRVLQERIALIIAIFCRGTVKPEFYDDYFRKVHIEPDQVETVKVERGYIAGTVKVHLKDSATRELSFASMNAYRQAGIHSKPLCAWCAEHLGEEADIAVGDIFMPEYRIREAKHSAIIGRTEQSASLLEGMIARDRISAEFVGQDKYHRTFSKVEKMSDTLTSRYLAAALVGQKRPRQLKEESGKFNVFHSAAWTLKYLNARLSDSKSGRKFLFILPSPLISLMAYITKGLSHL